MRIVPLALIAFAAPLLSAQAAPSFRLILAEQVADAPTHPDDQNRAGKPNPGSSESPSKKLSDSKGVIQPPATHDQSVVTPPPVESTGKAVIPPPGTPGGDQNVQPK
jgi:hypothetical protein